MGIEGVAEAGGAGLGLPEDWEELARVGSAMLLDAAGRAGERDRDAAYELLAADGVLTAACEAAAGGPEVETGLLAIVKLLSGAGT